MGAGAMLGIALKGTGRSDDGKRGARGKMLVGATGEMDMALLDGEAEGNDGVKLGASAFSFFEFTLEAELGIGKGLVPAAFGVACTSLLELVTRELDVDGVAVALGEMDFKSVIIFCRLLRASPPVMAVCFLVAALTAASIAVNGAETGA
jgi:hypothetical protein